MMLRAFYVQWQFSFGWDSRSNDCLQTKFAVLRRSIVSGAGLVSMIGEQNLTGLTPAANARCGWELARRGVCVTSWAWADKPFQNEFTGRATPCFSTNGSGWDTVTIARVSRTGGSGWDLSTGYLVGAVLKVVRHEVNLYFYLLFFESCDFFFKMTGYACFID